MTLTEPDVVIIRGNAKQVMLLAEATNATGGSGGIMGRPTCAMLPAVMKTQQAAMSLGCITNRVYNELGDDECYFAIPGAGLADIFEKFVSITNANRQLREFHRNRRDS